MTHWTESDLGALALLAIGTAAMVVGATALFSIKRASTREVRDNVIYLGRIAECGASRRRGDERPAQVGIELRR